MYKYQKINIGSFSNLDEISKGKKTVEMDKKDFVDEHKHLVNVLNSPSKEDDKKEAKDQKKELDEELKKGGEGSKGGKIIGHTKSGKPIYENHLHSSHEKFNKQDHLDAKEHHMKYLRDNLPLGGDKDTEYTGHSKAATHHHEKAKTAEGKGYGVNGHTKSGKEVTDGHESHTEFAENHKHYSAQDHKDAAEIHSNLRKHNNEQYQKHLDSVTPDEYNDDNNPKGKEADRKMKEANKKSKMFGKLAEWHEQAAKEKGEVDKKEIKKSLDMDISNKTISNSDLIKSHIGYQFSSSENLKVTKKGTEIKEKLKAIKDKELVEISGYQSKMEALKAVIPTAPSEPANDYNYEGIEVPEKLMIFPWNETYCNEEKSTMVISASETKPEKSEAQILCDNKREYNRSVDKIIECQKEIVLVNTMLNNFNDSKTYDLSVRQAAVIGF
jgi:hypothetical protein